MRLGVLAAGVALGMMVMLGGCSSQQPQDQQMGTLEEYENYGPWNDPYAYGYGVGYDPYSPFWYSPYPYYYPYYYYPIYPGPWYIVPPRRPGGPIRPGGGRHGGGHHSLVAVTPPPPSPPVMSREPDFREPMRTAPLRVR